MRVLEFLKVSKRASIASSHFVQFCSSMQIEKSMRRKGLHKIQFSDDHKNVVKSLIKGFDKLNGRKTKPAQNRLLTTLDSTMVQCRELAGLNHIKVVTFRSLRWKTQERLYPTSHRDDQQLIKTMLEF